MEERAENKVLCSLRKSPSHVDVEEEGEEDNGS